MYERLTCGDFVKIKQKYQQIFQLQQQEFNVHPTHLASLWYQIAYQEASVEFSKKKPKVDVLILLSFPWTVHDIMSQIKR
jgi:hypothetical protein